MVKRSTDTFKIELVIYLPSLFFKYELTPENSENDEKTVAREAMIVSPECSKKARAQNIQVMMSLKQAVQESTKR